MVVESGPSDNRWGHLLGQRTTYKDWWNARASVTRRVTATLTLHFCGEFATIFVMELHFFDRNENVAVVERRLPHWSQSGVICFITFRTHDSMPQHVVARWHDERNKWLQSHQINTDHPGWQLSLQRLDLSLQHEFFATFSTRWHKELDKCHGDCVLRLAENAKIVSDSLLHFDGKKYVLTDFVIMPNHVHFLTAFKDDDSMLKQCAEWKRFTGRGINANMRRSGRFWQQDGFDHLVRSDAQFLHFRNYIANNPQEAGLQDGEYVLFSK